MTALFDVPWPAAILPPPAVGVACTFTLNGPGPVTLQIWRRRTLVVPNPTPRPGQAPRVSLDGKPLPTQVIVLEQGAESVSLNRKGDSYSTFCEDLTSSIGAARPWIWWQVVPGTYTPPGGALVVLAGGARVTSSTEIVIGSDGVPSWLVEPPGVLLPPEPSP
jgi:hypothetical protein